METSLEEISAPTLLEVDTACIASMSLSDSTCETRLLLRDCNQVHVIGHQAPSQIANTKSSTLFRKKIEIGVSIVIGEENIHSSHTALDNVMRHSWYNDTRNPSHVGLYHRKAVKRNRMAKELGIVSPESRNLTAPRN